MQNRSHAVTSQRSEPTESLDDFPTPPRLHQRIQLRPPTEDPAWPHTIRIHLQMLENRTRTIQIKSAPSNAGTKHLVCHCLSAANLQLKFLKDCFHEKI